VHRPVAIVVMLCLAAAGASAVGCGDTLQDKPVPHNLLEGLVVAPTPVYWLGRSFAGHQITEVGKDTGGAYILQYGDCLEGGQSACAPPLRVITSPDNGFLPGGSAPQQSTKVRGAPAVIARRGRTIEIATGPVVVDIIAHDAHLAAAAAAAIAPINEPAWPGQHLPPRAADTGFAKKPLAAQEPSPVRPLPPAG
jgi:hypothetical protein